MKGHRKSFYFLLFVLIGVFSTVTAIPIGSAANPASDKGLSGHPNVTPAGRIAEIGHAPRARVQAAGAESQAVSAPAIYSGSWYNTDRNGEGFEFQLLEDGRFVMIFYTYPGPTDDALARQSFILGVGSIDGSVATIKDAYRTSGPVLGPGYDKSQLKFETWGDFSVEFIDENTARVEYDGADGSGTTNVTRLTSLMNPAVQSTLPSGMSGMWYDEVTNGQGWFVEILDEQHALIYWFTYDENGNQAWSLSVGFIEGNAIRAPTMASRYGTRFGDEFNSQDIILQPAEPLIIRFSSCNEGSVSVLDPVGAVFLRYPVTRLSKLMGHSCTDLPDYTVERPAGRSFYFVAVEDTDSVYFRNFDVSISWEEETQHILRIDFNEREVVKVESNLSPSYAPSEIYSYTVDDRYFVREEYETQHFLSEYDPQTLERQSNFRVHNWLDFRCSAITSTSYFYRIREVYDSFLGRNVGGEFMRLDLDGGSGDEIGVQLQESCFTYPDSQFQNLQSSNDVLYDARYVHEFDGSSAGIGLFTRDPVTGISTLFNGFLLHNADQFARERYSFHFDGDTVFIVRVLSSGGFQLLRYIHGLDTGLQLFYESGQEIPADFKPHYRDADEGYVVLASESGFIVQIDTINFRLKAWDLETDIYDMSFLHVKD